MKNEKMLKKCVRDNKRGRGPTLNCGGNKGFSIHLCFPRSATKIFGIWKSDWFWIELLCLYLQVRSKLSHTGFIVRGFVPRRISWWRFVGYFRFKFVIVSRNQSFEGIIFFVGNLESIVLSCFKNSLWKFGIEGFNLF